MKNGYQVASCLYKIVSVQIILVMYNVFFGYLLITECLNTRNNHLIFVNTFLDLILAFELC